MSWSRVLVLAWILGATAAAAAPRAVLVEPKHVDAGEVEPDAIQKLEWTLKNAGDAPLSIAALEPTCYCTTAKADAWEVPAGGTTKIRVTIDPSDFVGKITKGVEIETNDPDAPKQLVDVDLVVRPGIAVVPPELDFGAVPAAGSKERTVDLKAAKERPFELTAVSAEAPWLAVDHDPMQIEDRAGYRLYVKVKPGAPAGALATKIVVATTDAGRPRIEIAVRGTGPGGLRVEPARLVFEAAPGGAVGAIAVSGGKGFKVTGVSSSSPSVEAAVEPQADGSYRVAVRLAAAAKPGRVLAKLAIATSDAAQPEVTVPVMGLVK